MNKKIELFEFIDVMKKIAKCDSKDILNLITKAAELRKDELEEE